ncbi:hypothetical protein [Caulobacter henricii]|uniref:Uncharacterized protein n=1 Tax=Caulobacter henricii TaxID=69395 RepID=A0A0P0P271_9CAUL|nr:hypothetical protein [Caulobacter henricii]ALL14631.1 hypothetical protein AQ619_15435 [Caulobacter henricii]
MEFDRLEQAWRSDANTPTDESHALLKEQLMHTLKTRRHLEMLLAGIPTVTLTLFTVMALAAVLKNQGAGWPGIAMLAVCWMVMGTLLWNGFRHRSRDTGSPLRDTVAGLLAANRRARSNCHVFWAMLPVFMLPLFMAIQRLQDDGRMNTTAGWQAMAVCGLALAASTGWNLLRYILVLKPEQRRLEALLADYGT